MVHGWSYMDARDLGNLVQCCIETDGLGFEVFNAVNDESTFPEGKAETVDWLRTFCPETEILDEGGLRGRKAPVCNKKAREVLGFREEFPWREVRRKWEVKGAGDGR